MRNLEELMSTGDFNFDELDAPFFLLGLLSAFDNRYQAKADSFFEEISCKEPPTIKDLAQIMGSSHQNVKQILNKLEKKGYVQTISDQIDKRKQRIIVTEKMKAFCEVHDEGSQMIVGKIFEGIAPENIATTISTILMMEKNLEKI